ncbi:hypothetical protein BaRGS_00033966, partial [Batillaria attramentaria]
VIFVDGHTTFYHRSGPNQSPHRQGQKRRNFYNSHAPAPTLLTSDHLVPRTSKDACAVRRVAACVARAPSLGANAPDTSVPQGAYVPIGHDLMSCHTTPDQTKDEATRGIVGEIALTAVLIKLGVGRHLLLLRWGVPRGWTTP